MIVRRFYDEKLAQASWLVGCARTGEALVVDPLRDVDAYVRAAAQENLEITHVTETHIHADFVSGARELAALSGARLYLSDEGDARWKYAYAEEADAVLLKDGDEFMVGNVRVRVMHTPGHTPEHLSFVITDTAGADQPMGVFTGDFVFVGDVGRPDLLERAAGMSNTMEAGARSLFRSLQRFKQELPDFVQLWPGHGAGSACGKALGAVPQTTLGYERLFNWALRIEDEQEFVDSVLAGQPDPPKYFAQMKRINQEGPRLLGGFRLPQRLQADRLPALVEAGATIIDTRPAAEFAAGHVPGSVNIPLNRSFSAWAGWLAPYDRDLYLVVDGDEDVLGEALRDLALIGLDRVAGWFDADAVTSWPNPDRLPALDIERLDAMRRDGSATIVDVRGRGEWEAGHIPGAMNIPLGYLADRLAEIPADRPVVVHCESGGRSAIAASVLRASGLRDVYDAPGFARWRASGRPLEQGMLRDVAVTT